jgi:hypothetical protein
LENNKKGGTLGMLSEKEEVIIYLIIGEKNIYPNLLELEFIIYPILSQSS